MPIVSVEYGWTELTVHALWVQHPCGIVPGEADARIETRRVRRRQQHNLGLRRLFLCRVDEGSSDAGPLVRTADRYVGEVCHVSEVRDAPCDAREFTVDTAGEYQVGVSYHRRHAFGVRYRPAFAEPR